MLTDTVPKLVPSAAQMAYRLDIGFRFTLGFPDADVRQTAAIIAVHPDWLEYHLEDKQGRLIQPPKSLAVRIDTFRATILAALPPLSTAEQEARGYR